MDKIYFKIHKNQIEPFATDIFINGKDLIKILRAYELPFAKKEGRAGIAGGYTGINRKILYKYISKPANEVTIYACGGCGEEGCWPMLISIKEESDKIIWKNFRQPHRGKDSKTSFWDYSDFPEFSFDKDDYYKALEQLKK